MAYRRSLSTRAALIARAYNNPSFSYIPRDHHDRDSTLSRREVHNFIQQRSSFGRVSQYSLGSAFIRYMSTSVGEGGGSDNKIELMSNVADVVSDTTVTTQVNEVAIAAANSFWPGAVQQHFFDAVHNFTGLEWLVVATLLCRCAAFPLLLHQLEPFEVKKKQMEEEKATDPEAVADCQKQMQKAHKENCTGTYRAFIRPTWVYVDYALITGCFIAVSLTFPDSSYLWPILFGQSFLIAVEDTMQKFTMSDHRASTLRFITTSLAVPLVLSTVDCPKAICCYLITSNMFSLAYVLAPPGFRKALGVPKLLSTPAN